MVDKKKPLVLFDHAPRREHAPVFLEISRMRFSRAGIEAQRYTNIASGGQDMFPEMHRLAMGFIGGGNQNLAASSHRLAAGHGEIDEDLFDLAPVGLNRPQFLGWVDFQGDAFAEETIEHFHQSGDQFTKL